MVNWVPNFQKLRPYLPKVVYAFVGIIFAVSVVLAIDAFQYLKRNRLAVGSIYHYIVSYWEVFWLKFFDVHWLANKDIVLDVTPELGLYCSRLNQQYSYLQVYCYVPQPDDMLYQNLTNMNNNDYNLIQDMQSVVHIPFDLVKIDLRYHKSLTNVPRAIFENAKSVVVANYSGKTMDVIKYLKGFGFDMNYRHSARQGIEICYGKKVYKSH
jgi:hypothetical protein